MKKTLRTLCLFLVMLVSLATVAGCGTSNSATSTPKANFPTKPITIVVGFAPGGGLDITARAYAAELKKILGVDVVVQNMPGANGAIALNYVSKQPKDGYTMLCISSATAGYPATGVSKLDYKDVDMLGIMFGSAPIIMVSPDSPITDGKEFIAALKKGGLTGSNSGMGGISHIPEAVLAKAVGGSFKPVPYNGGNPAGMAVAKKEVDFGVADPGEVLALLNAKMVKPLFVISDKAFTVPTAGITIPSVLDFAPQMKGKITDAVGWRGLAYAKGVPADREKIMIDALKKASQSDSIKALAAKDLLIPTNIFGADADKVLESNTVVQSWLLYDLKVGTISPATVGIPRPSK